MNIFYNVIILLCLLFSIKKYVYLIYHWEDTDKNKKNYIHGKGLLRVITIFILVKISYNKIQTNKVFIEFFDINWCHTRRSKILSEIQSKILYWFQSIDKYLINLHKKRSYFAVRTIGYSPLLGQDNGNGFI